MDTQNETTELSRRERRQQREQRPHKLGRRSVIALGLALAIGCGGYAAYEAFGTDAPAQEHAAEVRDGITLITANGEVTLDRDAVTSAAAAQTGEAFGIISNPLFGEQPLVKSAWDPEEELTDAVRQENAEATQALIDSGVVVAYGSREKPGEQGNLAVIGHRITHGSVFNRAVELRDGDEIQVTTADGEHTYRVIREAFRVEAGDHSILGSMKGEGPSILDWLDGHDIDENSSLMTLITCGNWMTDHREVVVLELAE